MKAVMKRWVAVMLALSALSGCANDWEEQQKYDAATNQLSDLISQSKELNDRTVGADGLFLMYHREGLRRDPLLIKACDGPVGIVGKFEDTYYWGCLEQIRVINYLIFRDLMRSGLSMHELERRTGYACDYASSVVTCHRVFRFRMLKSSPHVFPRDNDYHPPISIAVTALIHSAVGVPTVLLGEVTATVE